MKPTFYNLIIATALTLMTTGAHSAIVPSGPAMKSTSRFVNVETPFRCAVKHFDDIDVSTTIALKDSDFKLTYFDKMDDLPRFEVNGLSFTHTPIDEALQKLVDEADISVYTEDGFYSSLDAQDVYGELTDVVNELTAAGDIFYRYDSRKKELYLSRKGRFELRLPNNRMVMLAMLDALRGARINDIRPNWDTNTLLLTLTQQEKKTVEELVSYIQKDGQLLLADTQVYVATPKSPETSWQQVIRRYGAARIHSVNNGLIGKIIGMGNQIPARHFLQAINTDFSLAKISQGVAIVPNGWKMRFNVGQCALTNDFASLSVLYTTHILGPDKIDTKITLDSKGGEIASFDTVSGMDNELVLVGIPSRTGSKEELVVTVKLRFIRLVKED